MSENWLHINPSSGNKNTIMTISADTNDTGAVRKAKIIVTAGTMTRTIDVVQQKQEIVPNQPDVIATYETSSTTLRLLQGTTGVSSYTIFLNDEVVLTGSGHDTRLVTSTDYNALIGLETGDTLVVWYYYNLGTPGGTQYDPFYMFSPQKHYNSGYIPLKKVELINGWHELVGLPYLEEVWINETLTMHYGDRHVYDDASHIYDCPKLSAFTGTHTGITEDHSSFIRYDNKLYAYAPAANEVYVAPNGVTGITRNCFVYRNDYSFTATTQITPLTVKEIIIPDSVSIYLNSSSADGLCYLPAPGGFAYKGFMGNNSVTSITLSSNLVCSDMRAYFINCSALTSVNLPSGFTGQTSCMFKGCSSLQSVVLPNGTKDIEPYQFMDCSSLKSLYIPDGFTGFTYSAGTQTNEDNPSQVIIIRGYFNGCDSLTSITANNQDCSSITITAATFLGVGYDGKLYAPKTSDYSAWLNENPYYLGYYRWTDGTWDDTEFDIRLSTYILSFPPSSTTWQSVFATATRPDYTVNLSLQQNATSNTSISWLTLSGSPSAGTVEFKVRPNEVFGNERRAYMHFVFDGQIWATVAIIQSPEGEITPSITANPTAVTFFAEASGISYGQVVNISSNVNWELDIPNSFVPHFWYTLNQDRTQLTIYPTNKNTSVRTDEESHVYLNYSGTTYQTIDVKHLHSGTTPVLSYSYEFELYGQYQVAIFMQKVSGSNGDTLGFYVNDTLVTSTTYTAGSDGITVDVNAPNAGQVMYKFGCIITGNATYDVSITSNETRSISTYNKVHDFCHLGNPYNITSVYLDCGYLSLNTFNIDKTSIMPLVSQIQGSSPYITTDRRACVGDSYASYGCFVSGDPTTITSWTGNYTLMCYATSGLTSISIPEGYLMWYFENSSPGQKNNGIKSITLPSNPIPGTVLFTGWGDLTSVTINSTFINGMLTMFKGCSGLTSVTLPRIYGRMYEYNFSGSSITSITFTDDVENNFNYYAFYGIKPNGVIHYSSRLNSGTLSTLQNDSNLSSWTFVQDVP